MKFPVNVSNGISIIIFYHHFFISTMNVFHGIYCIEILKTFGLSVLYINHTYEMSHFTVMTCQRLTLNNGNISFSSNQYVYGSIAIHTCDADNGYVLSNPNITTRTCLLAGWSGSEISCEC